MRSVTQSKLLLVSFFLVSVSSPGYSQEDPTKTWRNETEFSLVTTNGNSKTSSTAGRNTFTNKWGRFGLELTGGGQGSQDQGSTTSEKYDASQKVTYSFTERNYVFERFGWDKDRFAGIAHRYDAAAGLGRELIQTPLHSLILELGGGYINEQRTNDARNDFASGRAYSKYVRIISPTAKLSQDAEYLYNFENSSDYRVNTETSVTAAMSAHFSLKVGYKWTHVGQPPPGFGRNDTTTLVALLAVY